MSVQCCVYIMTTCELMINVIDNISATFATRRRVGASNAMPRDTYNYKCKRLNVLLTLLSYTNSCLKLSDYLSR